MKAQVLHQIGDIRFEDMPDPVAGRGEVLVAVRACGICGSDVPRVYETGAHWMPLVIGHEFAGEVMEAGEGVDSRWIGKRVGVFPLIPCKKCSQCCARKYEMCESYNYLGSRCDGGFAEYVTVPEWNLFAISEKVSYEAAAMGEPMAVAVHAIRQAGLLTAPGSGDAMRKDALLPGMDPDEPVLVWGLGTIGLLVVMFLLDAGFGNVYAVGNKPFQRDMALAVGLPENRYLDAAEDVTGRGGKAGVSGKISPSVFFDCVGKNEVLQQGIEMAAPSGRIVAVGNPASDMCLPKDCYWKILRKQLALVGTWNSSFTKEPEDDWNYVFFRLESGSIHPERIISHRFSLEKMADGLALMRQKSEPYAKIMIS